MIFNIYMIAEWEDKEVSKSKQEKTSLQDQTLIQSLHISDAKWIQKMNENSTCGQ